MHPTVPLDLCQNNCTPPICHDPAKIVLGRVISKLTIHGLLATATPVDLSARSFVLQLSDVSGHVLYRNFLEAGSLVGLADVGTYKYESKTARVSGGIAKISTKRLRNGYRITALAYGDLSQATDQMVTHVYADPEEWTVVGHWLRGSSGWRFTDR